MDNKEEKNIENKDIKKVNNSSSKAKSTKKSTSTKAKTTNKAGAKKTTTKTTSKTAKITTAKKNTKPAEKKESVVSEVVLENEPKIVENIFEIKNEEKIIEEPIKIIPQGEVSSLNNIADNKTEELKTNKKNKSTFGLFEVIVLIVATILIFSIVGYFIGNREKKSSGEYSTASKEIQTFIEEYNYILENYYGDVDKEELISSAIKGMLSSLDEYSQFVGEDSNNFSITLEGSYQGVGIAISNNESGDIVIREVYANTPASRAGLQPNDIITKFNDTELKNVSSSDLVSMIGNVSEMSLTVLRGGEELTFTVTKEIVTLNSIYSEMKDNNIGYIQVSIFANNTYEQFQNALIDLENQGMQSLIIDLRGNSGGHLSAVEKMLYLFLDETHVIYQTEDKNGTTKFYSKGKTDKEYPIVILQNLSSASASEIMASTLREELGAYIIGTTSFGKGTVQELQTVSGIGQYKFTTKKWLTPNGEWINEVGVVPDQEVSLTVEYLQNPTLENDPQYQAAIEYLTK